MSCSIETRIPFSSYNTELLYDEINNSIFNINEVPSHDNYSSMESKFSLSIISEDTKCRSCNLHYSFIRCSECKKETCGNSHCCTLFPDYYGYISICKECEQNVSNKLLPYKEKINTTIDPYEIIILDLIKKKIIEYNN